MTAHQIKAIVPGILGCAGAGILAMLMRPFIPTISPLLWAIVFGVIVANVITIPDVLTPGIGFTGKHVLRAGIVLLGFQLVLGDIISLGWKALLFVVAIVALGMMTGIIVGRALGLSAKQYLLVGTGFSICGAAAVAGAAGVLDAEDEDVATSVGLVVLFGSAMIALVPALAALAGLAPRAAGIFAGGSTHEVAQVVAEAGIIGGSVVLSTAVLMKMARVLMLAPLIAVLSLWSRKNLSVDGGRRPPIMPLFVFLFLVAIGIGSAKIIPTPAAHVLKEVQTFFLASAMFALGCGVRIATLIKVGWKPFALGLAVTSVVTGLSFVAALVA
ncbi:MAG: YeiH family protein [Propionibacteriaceae bacterium]